MNKKHFLIIAAREIRSYFFSPVAYIVTALFCLTAGILFFTTFYFQNTANMRGFFSLLPVLLSLFVPAISMKSFSEERKSGSIESLMTLPVTHLDVVAGKFLAVFLSSVSLLVPTVLFLSGILPFASVEVAPILGGYLSAVFLCLSFSAIGLFTSALSRNQIVAFFSALFISIALTLLKTFLIFLPAQLVEVLSYISIENHFTSISRGVIDSRDLVYFLSLSALFFAATLSVREEDV